MTRFPDPSRSRAVLIGTSRYPQAPGLADLPAVRANVVDLHAALTDTATGTLPAEHCVVVNDPESPFSVGNVLTTRAGEATDLLFVYYSGHGLVDERGRFYLALSTTDPAQPRWTALPFDALREEISSSPAALRVLVLDCCFSGRAIEAMSDSQGVITGQIDIAGTYTVTSTTANSTSYAPKGATHTAFTAALLTALGRPQALTLNELFDHMHQHLVTRGFPRPQRRIVNHSGALALSKGSVAVQPAVTVQTPPAVPVNPSPPPVPAERPVRTASATTAVPVTGNEVPNAPHRVSRPGATLGVLLALPWLMGLGSSTVSAAAPSMQRAFHLSTTSLAWAFNVNSLAFLSLLLLGSHLGDILGRRRVTLVGTTLLSVALPLAAVMPNGSWLIAAQALQGIGAACAAPNALALIAASLHGKPSRNKGLALFAVTPTASAALGLIVGVVLTTWVSWRWALLINLPVGLAMTLLAVRYLPRTAARRQGFDLIGATTATGGVGALLFGFVHAAAAGWGDSVTVAALAIAACLLAAFVVAEAHAEHPIIPAQLVHERQRASAHIIVLLVSAAVLGAPSLSSFLFQLGGYSLLASALASLPMAVTYLAAARAVPALLPRYGAQRLTVLGASLMAGGMLWLTQLTPNAGTGTIGPLLVLGSGAGLAIGSLTLTVFTAVPPRDCGVVSGTLQSAQGIGSAVGANFFLGITGRGSTVVDRITETCLIGTAFAIAAVLVALYGLRGVERLSTL